MADRPRRASDAYLRRLSGELTGSRRARLRLLREIRDHLEDAIAGGVAAGMPGEEAERDALERLGPPAALLDGWRARSSRARARRRGRVGITILAGALAAGLAVAQHAEGGRDPAPPPVVCHAGHAPAPPACR